MTNPNYIHREWFDFAKIIPATAPLEQRTEMRRAFFAGATACLAAILSNLSDGDGVNPSDEAMMDHIHQELEAFAIKVGKGEA